MNKQIINIVIYNKNNKKMATIFYEDNSTEEVSYEEALKKLKDFAKELNITTKKDFKEKLVDNIVHVTTYNEFKKNYDDYKGIDLNDDADGKNDKDEETYKKELKIALGVSAVVIAIILSNPIIKRLKSQSLSNNNMITKSNDNNENNNYYENQNYVYVNDKIEGNENIALDSITDFETLLEKSNNETQKQSMRNIKNSLTNYNILFANSYIEEDKNIKAALTYDEAIALQQAYNNYNKEDIRIIFNDFDVNNIDLSKLYRNATLQLMGAHIIENQNNPVNMSTLINDEEEKKVYNKVHNLFLEAKFASSEEKIKKIDDFYREIKKLFPINEENVEGISHIEENTIESYKLSLTPMIAAAEYLFKNEIKDITLTDKEIEYINNIGLCNLADEKYEKISMISLTSYNDINNPTYDNFKKVISTKLHINNSISDAERDLSKLDAFIKITKDLAESIEATEINNSVYKKYQEISSSDAKKEIDSKIAKENNDAKKQAEKKAKEKKNELQEKENKKAAKIREEIKQSEKQLQKDIDKANNNINNNKSVNEKDFSGNVKFDDKHKDNNGNLNNSVENITTNKDNDQTNQSLPDPNETGKKFDKEKQTDYNGTTIIEYEEEYTPGSAEEKTYVLTR